MQAPEGVNISAYEKRALAEIAAWRNPPDTWMAQASRKAAESWSTVTDLVTKIPGVEWAMENVITGLLELTNEITQDSVWTEAVLKDFHGKGYQLAGLSAIRNLDLEDVDKVLSGLDKKYIGLASAEGVATGAAGAAGIVPDLVALVALNLRAAGETATYCGFDMSDPKRAAVRPSDSGPRSQLRQLDQRCHLGTGFSNGFQGSPSTQHGFYRASRPGQCNRRYCPPAGHESD